MSFNKHNNKNHREFNIRITSKNDNTIGYINLNPQFVRVATGKQVENCTVQDIENIGGDFAKYLSTKATITIDSETDEPTVSLEDF